MDQVKLGWFLLLCFPFCVTVERCGETSPCPNNNKCSSISNICICEDGYSRSPVGQCVVSSLNGEPPAGVGLYVWLSFGILILLSLNITCFILSRIRNSKKTETIKCNQGNAEGQANRNKDYEDVGLEHYEGPVSTTDQSDARTNPGEYINPICCQIEFETSTNSNSADVVDDKIAESSERTEYINPTFCETEFDKGTNSNSADVFDEIMADSNDGTEMETVTTEFTLPTNIGPDHSEVASDSTCPQHEDLLADSSSIIDSMSRLSKPRTPHSHFSPIRNSKKPETTKCNQGNTEDQANRNKDYEDVGLELADRSSFIDTMNKLTKPRTPRSDFSRISNSQKTETTKCNQGNTEGQASRNKDYEDVGLELADRSSFIDTMNKLTKPRTPRSDFSRIRNSQKTETTTCHQGNTEGPAKRNKDYEDVGLEHYEGPVSTTDQYDARTNPGEYINPIFCQNEFETSTNYKSADVFDDTIAESSDRTEMESAITEFTLPTNIGPDRSEALTVSTCPQHKDLLAESSSTIDAMSNLSKPKTTKCTQGNAEGPAKRNKDYEDVGIEHYEGPVSTTDQSDARTNPGEYINPIFCQNEFETSTNYKSADVFDDKIAESSDRTEMESVITEFTLPTNIAPDRSEALTVSTCPQHEDLLADSSSTIDTMSNLSKPKTTKCTQGNADGPAKRNKDYEDVGLEHYEGPVLTTDQSDARTNPGEYINPIFCQTEFDTSTNSNSADVLDDEIAGSSVGTEYINLTFCETEFDTSTNPDDIMAESSDGRETENVATEFTLPTSIGSHRSEAASVSKRSDYEIFFADYSNTVETMDKLFEPSTPHSNDQLNDTKDKSTVDLNAIDRSNTIMRSHKDRYVGYCTLALDDDKKIVEDQHSYNGILFSDRNSKCND